MNITQHFSYEELNRDNLRLSPFLRQNLQSLAVFLEIVRLYFGKPIIVTSGLRSAQHNAAIGGVSNSLHLIGKAVDITCSKKEDFKTLSQIVYFILDGEFFKSQKVYQEHHPQKLYIHVGIGDRDEVPLDLLKGFPFSILPTYSRKIERLEEQIKDLQTQILYEKGNNPENS